MTAPRSQIVTYGFPASAQGWAFDGSWDAGWSALGPFAGGSLLAEAVADAEGAWLLEGTWAELFGIPEGQAVQTLAIDLWYAAALTGMTAEIEPITLNGEELTDRVAIAATTPTWVNLTGSVNVPPQQQGAGTEIALAISLACVGAGSAAVRLAQIVLTAGYAGQLGRSTATYYGFQGGRAQWVSGWGQQGAGN